MKIFLSILSVLLCITSFSQQVFTPAHFHELQFAHRGGYSDILIENTIATIRYSIEVLHAPAVEIDVMNTADHQLIAFHDDYPDRVMQDAPHRLVEDMQWSTLQSLRFKADPDRGIETMDEVLNAMIELAQNGHQFLLEIDFKPQHPEVIRQTVAIIEEKEAEFGEVIYDYFFISSFYPDVLGQIRELSPKTVTAFAVHNQPSKHKLKAKLAILLAPHFIKKYEASIIEPNICMVTPRFVRKYKRKGILINAYTANTACEKEYIENLDIAYTTNCPQGTCPRDDSGQKTKPKKWCKKCY